jgi:hypothetical protein
MLLDSSRRMKRQEPKRSPSPAFPSSFASATRAASFPFARPVISCATDLEIEGQVDFHVIPTAWSQADETDGNKIDPTLALPMNWYDRISYLTRPPTRKQSTGGAIIRIGTGLIPREHMPA